MGEEHNEIDRLKIEVTGKKLRAARDKKHWTQRELAERFGYKTNTITIWEMGRLPYRDLLKMRLLKQFIDETMAEEPENSHKGRVKQAASQMARIHQKGLRKLGQ
jgi:transcriptional regulator with XRE-family HTH domain